MRVLHVQKVKGIGGSERHLLSLLPGLAAAGDDVRIVVLAAGEDEGRFLGGAAHAGIDAVSMPAGADADPRTARLIAKEVRAFAPDVVHTHLVHADLWGQLAARRAGVPGVRSAHNLSPRYRREPGRTAGRIAGRLARRSIAISEHVADFLREQRLAPPDRIRVVPDGIDATGWTLHDEARAVARTRLGFEPDEVVAGMASRLIDGKGHALAIAAMRRTVAQTPEVRLAIAGDGPLRPEIERLANALPSGTVRFLGQLTHVPSFMAACDLLLFPTLPSLGEGFGLAALEAMAAERPVLATNVGALPEVVEDGVTGVIVSPQADPRGKALAELALDPGRRRAMGVAGRERAASRFSLDAMVEATRAVYREVRS